MVKWAVAYVTDRWRGESGYRQVLVVALPLVLSTGSWSVQHFVDRMFLTWYSSEAVAASMPAGMLNFTLVSLFIGTAGYASTFVAQYHGAGRHERMGPVVWQGLYIAIGGGVAVAATAYLAGPFFRFVGHDAAIRDLEADYFRVLALGSFFPIANAALGGFFSGRGRTWPVMWANVAGTLVNLVMDYALIFGKWGFPEMGITGAAIATVLSGATVCLIYVALLSGPGHDRQFHTLRGWRFDGGLLRRLMRFGLPNGVQFFLDMSGFAAFILLMGRLGTVPLAATNIAFNISTLAFLPMLGFGVAVSVLVGQSLGKEAPALAQRAVYSALHITLLYMGVLAALFLFVPGIFVAPFAAQADASEFEPVRAIAVVALRFVAAYNLFDALNIVLASALKGAGDTRYVMLAILCLSALVLVAPTYVALVHLDADVFAAWGIATAYIMVTAIAFLLRFLGGRWKSMRVIEAAPTVA